MRTMFDGLTQRQINGCSMILALMGTIMIMSSPFIDLQWNVDVVSGNIAAFSGVLLIFLGILLCHIKEIADLQRRIEKLEEEIYDE